MSRIIILEHDGGEMGNQLWGYISIYAYALEKGYACENYSFFEFARYFNLTPKSKIINSLFFLPFRRYGSRRSALRVKLYRLLYKIFVARPVTLLFANRVVYSRDGVDSIFYLPPTIPTAKKLVDMERSQKTIYFAQVSGGVFRNPEGISKHRDLIIKHFAPAPWVAEKVKDVIGPLRSRYKTIIGVHIRQGDYAVFKGGKFAISSERIRSIMDEYLAFSHKNPNEVVFVLVSDGSINEGIFHGLNIKMSRGSAGEDLFVLASCDAIIGSDSTFGHFASYYGNIPHLVMKNEPMDWNYYLGKNSYFTNKYFTVMLM